MRAQNGYAAFWNFLIGRPLAVGWPFRPSVVFFNWFPVVRLWLVGV